MKRFERTLGRTASLAVTGLMLSASATAAQDVYRVVTLQAAPGRILDVIELVREERTLLRSLGEEAPLWLRHSQGDLWDLMLVYPISSMAEHYAEVRLERIADASTPSGRSGADLQLEIDAATAWREEVFVRGPAVGEVKEAWAGAGFFHVEMFVALGGKRAELLAQREMENDYLARLGRKPNHIFSRIAGASTDSFTIGYYRDLKQYANPPEVTREQQEAAAVAAGFQGADYIGSYLRELLLRHHDTLAVAIP